MEKTFNLTAKFIGFFPKKNDYNNFLSNEGITEICSVSECIRNGPDGWINQWKHNDLGFYNSEDIVQSLIKKKTEEYTFFAYKLFLFCYKNGELKSESKMILRANKLSIAEELTNYSLVGFDVVSCSESDFFECSALSCNGAFEKYKVNEYCLLQDLGSAINAQEEISEGN